MKILLLLICIAAPALSASVSQDLMYYQADSPLHIIAVGCKPGRSLAEIVVANTSGNKVLRARFGWEVFARHDARHGETFVGDWVAINLEPGGFQLLPGPGIPISETDKIGMRLNSQDLLARAGLVDVVFDTGKSWSFSLASDHLFAEKEDNAVRERIAPILVKFQAWRNDMFKRMDKQLKDRGAKADPDNGLWGVLESWLHPQIVQAFILPVCNPGRSNCESNTGCGGGSPGCCSTICGDPTNCGLQDCGVVH